MILRKALPKRQLKCRSVPCKCLHPRTRTQFHSFGPRYQTPNSASPDPIQVLHVRAQSLNAAAVPQRSLLGRFLRGIFYVGVFSVTGFAAAWGWKTWMYLRMGQAIGKPATRQRNKEWFSSAISNSALVKSMRQDGWIEEDPLNRETTLEDSARPARSATQKSQHMVNEKLVGDGYLATKHFRHPTDGMTMLVFMADFGCESWPSTLHGGIATTVIQEALDTHLKTFPEYAPIRNRETTMNYRLPLAPGIMYSVLVRTDRIEYPYQTAVGADKSFMGVAVDVLLNEMVRAPKFVQKHSDATNTDERVLDVRNARKDVKAYVKGGSILFLASKDFREMMQNDPELVSALREKRDAWIKAYDSTKAKPTK